MARGQVSSIVNNNVAGDPVIIPSVWSDSTRFNAQIGTLQNSSVLELVVGRVTGGVGGDARRFIGTYQEPYLNGGNSDQKASKHRQPPSISSNPIVSFLLGIFGGAVYCYFWIWLEQTPTNKRYPRDKNRDESNLNGLHSHIW